MNDFHQDANALLKEIDLECCQNVETVEKLLQVIEKNNTVIYQLQNQIRSTENTQRKILAEHAKYSISSLATLFDVIWPMTSKPELQISLCENQSFVNVLIETYKSANSINLLYPIVGILANLNSNSSIRPKIGLDSVLLITEKPLIASSKYIKVALFLFYNVILDLNITQKLLQNGFLNYLLENVHKMESNEDIQNILIKLIDQIVLCFNKNDEVRLAFLPHLRSLYVVVKKIFKGPKSITAHLDDYFMSFE